MVCWSELVSTGSGGGLEWAPQTPCKPAARSSQCGQRDSIPQGSQCPWVETDVPGREEGADRVVAGSLKKVSVCSDGLHPPTCNLPFLSCFSILASDKKPR